MGKRKTMSAKAFQALWDTIDDIDELGPHVSHKILQDAKASWLMANLISQHEQSPCARCGFKVAHRCSCAQREHFGRTCFGLYNNRDQMFPLKFK